MIRATSSPSSSTTGRATLIFAIRAILAYRSRASRRRLRQRAKIEAKAYRDKPTIGLAPHLAI